MLTVDDKLDLTHVRKVVLHPRSFDDKKNRAQLRTMLLEAAVFSITHKVDVDLCVFGIRHSINNVEAQDALLELVKEQSAKLP